MNKIRIHELTSLEELANPSAVLWELQPFVFVDSISINTES